MNVWLLTCLIRAFSQWLHWFKCHKPSALNIVIMLFFLNQTGFKVMTVSWFSDCSDHYIQYIASERFIWSLDWLIDLKYQLKRVIRSSVSFVCVGLYFYSVSVYIVSVYFWVHMQQKDVIFFIVWGLFDNIRGYPFITFETMNTICPEAGKIWLWKQIKSEMMQ